MNKLKDLTEDQCIELARLAYGPEDWIKSDFKFYYQEEILRDNISNSEDIPEYYFISFSAITFGDKIENIRLFIFGNYNLSMDIYRKNPISIITLNISNQILIFKKLVEWEYIIKILIFIKYACNNSKSKS